MLTVFPKVVENATGIESHKERYSTPQDSGVENIYVLISGFGEINDIIPVRLTIKEFNNGTTNKLYVAISLNKIKADILAYTNNNKSVIAPYTPSAFEISVPQFFSKINPQDGDLLKYIPDQFLDETQLQAKRDALKKEEAYIQNKVDNKNNDKGSDERVRHDGNGSTGMDTENQGNDSGIQPEAVPKSTQKQNIERNSGSSGSDGGQPVSKPIQPPSAKQSGSDTVQGGIESESDSDTSNALNSNVEQSTHSNGIRGTDVVRKNNIQQKLNTNNYRLHSELVDNTPPSFSKNIEAIRTLKRLETEHRNATPDEQAILAGYKSWGGLKDAFVPHTYQNGQLKMLLTPDEYKAANETINNAHFTSTAVIDKMYSALKQLGFKGGNLLEPSMGTGNFFGSMPIDLSAKTNLYGVEFDSLTGRIAKQLYPDANVQIMPFQDTQFSDNQFDAIIGNVPFNNLSIPYKGKKYLLHDYFFVKSLDKVKDGGVVMFLTSSRSGHKERSMI